MIELGGGDGYAYGLLAYAYAAKEDYQPAEAAYRSAMLLQPDNASGGSDSRSAVYKQEKFADAASLLDALVARVSRPRRLLGAAGAHCFIGMKQPLRAAEQPRGRRPAGQVDRRHACITLGDLTSSESLLDLAESAYRRAIDLDPNQPFAGRCARPRCCSQRGRGAAGRAPARAPQAVPGLRARRGGRPQAPQARGASQDGRGRGERGDGEVAPGDPASGSARRRCPHAARQALGASRTSPTRRSSCSSAPRASSPSRSRRRSRRAQVLVGDGPLRRRHAAPTPRAGDQAARERRALPRAGRAPRAREGSDREPVGRGFESSPRHIHVREHSRLPGLPVRAVDGDREVGA